LRIAQTICFCV
jgi:putative transposase